MNWQIGVLQFLESIRNDFLTMFFTTVTMMAESLFLVTVVAILYWCVDKIKSIRLAWFVLLGGVLNGVIKSVIKMPRPFESGVVMPIRAKTATGSSFPSGHTQAATNFWGGSMVIFKSKGAITVGTIMILLTALSRIYLGVHWPMDVLGGILFGIISIYLANVILGEKAVINKWHIIGANIVAILVMILPVEVDLYKTVAALWGMLLGTYIEQNFIKFEPKQTLKVQIKKVIIGLIGLIVLYVGLKKLFFQDKIFDMLRYAIVLLWISAGAPYVFKKLSDKK